MPNYEFFCEDCSCVTTGNFLYADRPETVPCTFCEKPARYMMSKPTVMHVALPDGTRRRGWADMKEAAKLNKEAAVARGETKRDIKKEIRKLGIGVEK